MTTKKASKLTARSRQKSSTASRKTSSKASKAAKSKAAKKKEKELEDRRKLMELTLKGFQMTYEAYQQGKFHRIL